MADTTRVDISYRPLRIGWAVEEGDLAAMRRAVRLSHALWGGRFNPIIVVNREEEARNIVELFRVDMVLPVGQGSAPRNFIEQFPHLVQPFQIDSILRTPSGSSSPFRALDLYNAIAYLQSRPEWSVYKGRGLRNYQWEPIDPLADAFLMQLGGLPPETDIGAEYADVVAHNVGAESYQLDPGAALPGDMAEHPGLALVGRFGLERHHAVRPRWDFPGFFFGSASDPHDLISYWNIRACDIPLVFIDLAHMDRYVHVMPEWARVFMSDLAHLPNESQRGIGMWSRQHIEAASKHLSAVQRIFLPVGDSFWEGGAISPPVMQLGEASTLGVMGTSKGVPRVNFALADKPFSTHVHFSHQNLVAAVSLIGGLYGDELHTFGIPYIPELNNFYSRQMHFHTHNLRIGPGTIDLVIDAFERDTFLTAMPVAALFKRLFKLAGLDSSLSEGGRIVRQLLTQLGGVQGARVFKIPGARSLLKTFGPTDTFTRLNALKVIRDKSAEHPTGTFSAHTNLFLKERPLDTRLTPPDVFDFLVGKGLYRMGADLRCLQCEMTSWVSLDALKQNIVCELCGHPYDATEQLIDLKWRFRRSGVLGTERNAQGAVPVALTLQQLDTTFKAVIHKNVYSLSLDINKPSGGGTFKCEIDFTWLEVGIYPERATLIIGECKDKGPISSDDFSRDVETLRTVADAFPITRFDTYILLTKLAPFTESEIALARTLNTPFHPRTILLTPRELEPYFIVERVEKELGRDLHVVSPKDLAELTSELYFLDPVVDGL